MCVLLPIADSGAGAEDSEESEESF
jgi:hypothetical protein